MKYYNNIKSLWCGSLLLLAASALVMTQFIILRDMRTWIIRLTLATIATGGLITSAGLMVIEALFGETPGIASANVILVFQG